MTTKAPSVDFDPNRARTFNAAGVKLSARVQWTRILANVMARNAGDPAFLETLLAITEHHMIMRRHHGWAGAPHACSPADWYTLENICFRRWTTMTEIAKLKDGGPAAPMTSSARSWRLARGLAPMARASY